MVNTIVVCQGVSTICSATDVPEPSSFITNGRESSCKEGVWNAMVGGLHFANAKLQCARLTVVISVVVLRCSTRTAFRESKGVADSPLRPSLLFSANDYLSP